MQFDCFGRNIGHRLLLHACLVPGLSYVLTPVNITRYFEFEYALASLPASPRRCLDVSSPALFSLFVARREPSTSILMANPDALDLNRTRKAAGSLKMSNIRFANCTADQLAECGEKFDCIWLISVVEHICGDYQDREAVRIMYDLLSPGGRLILTIPVDRTCWDEYRDCDYYGTVGKTTGGRYFFQRWYDGPPIHSRITQPIGVASSFVQWFGERIPGTFEDHQ